LTAGGLCETVP